MGSEPGLQASDLSKGWRTCWANCPCPSPSLLMPHPSSYVHLPSQPRFNFSPTHRGAGTYLLWQQRGNAHGHLSPNLPMKQQSSGLRRPQKWGSQNTLCKMSKELIQRVSNRTLGCVLWDERAPRGNVPPASRNHGTQSMRSKSSGVGRAKGKQQP